jgi:hypothetical protein
MKYEILAASENNGEEKKSSEIQIDVKKEEI